MSDSLDRTFEEYLEFCRNHPDQRYEYYDGQVVMLAGGSLNHSRIAVNITTFLKNALRKRSCQVFNSDAILRLSTGRAVLPDVAVSCDEGDHGDTDYIQFPCLIVEVLSESTEDIDRGRKFTYYRNVPSVKEYVLVNTREILVEVFRREKNTLWTIQLFGEGEEITLQSIGVTITVQAIYEDVVFGR